MKAKKENNLATVKVVSDRELVLIPLIFSIMIVGAHLLLRWLRYQTYFDMDQYWPVSLFLPKYPVWQDLITLLSVIGLWFLWVRAWTKKVKLLILALMTMLLIVSTNLFQGINDGLITPITGNDRFDHQYWQDVDRMTGVGLLMRNYVVLLPSLKMHSRVHPPGPMIVLYGLRKIITNPLVINLTMMVISVGLSSFLYLTLKDSFSTKSSRLFMAMLWLLPAIQIYYLASMDGLICGLFIFTYYWIRKSHKNIYLSLIAGLSIYLTLMMTYAGLLLFLVMIIEEWLGKKSLIRSGISILVIIFLGLIGVKFFGYNYIENFLKASKFESPGGFYLLKMPLSYLATRLEDVLEILVFLGPYLTFLLFKALKCIIKPKIQWIYLTMPLMLGGFLITGAYFTGETARAAMFIYPFLLIIIANYWEKHNYQLADEVLVMGLVFSQTVIMQMWGFYNW